MHCAVAYECPLACQRSRDQSVIANVGHLYGCAVEILQPFILIFSVLGIYNAVQQEVYNNLFCCKSWVLIWLCDGNFTAIYSYVASVGHLYGSAVVILQPFKLMFASIGYLYDCSGDYTAIYSDVASVGHLYDCAVGILQPCTLMLPVLGIYMTVQQGFYSHLLLCCQHWPFNDCTYSGDSTAI